MFPNSANYLPGISWDPTTAQYWDQFNADPNVVNEGKQPDQPGYRSFDARLSAPELALFKTNGFVVSERLGADSFAEVFYNLWHNDLPVFISTDALLQAWHRTYDAMLEEIEETYLFNSVQTMLDGMAAQVSSRIRRGRQRRAQRQPAWTRTISWRWRARCWPARTVRQCPRVLGQDARVAETLADIQAEQLKQVDDFMGFCRVVDFSQFKVRGHYTHTERLGRYFQCVMWLGRIDVPVAGGPWERCPGDERFASPREMGLAIVLWHLLNQSGAVRRPGADMEQIIETFVGCDRFADFRATQRAAGGRGHSHAGGRARPGHAAAACKPTSCSGELGVQNIRSDWFEQPLGGAARYALPQTFTVFGQKFVPDSWAFSQTVFSSILWVENGVTNKVQRRVPGRAGRRVRGAGQRPDCARIGGANEGHVSRSRPSARAAVPRRPALPAQPRCRAGGDGFADARARGTATST